MQVDRTEGDASDFTTAVEQLRVSELYSVIEYGKGSAWSDE